MGIYESIKALVEYLHDDEEHHYIESDKPKDHIYHDVLRVMDWLDSPSCPLTSQDEE